ncbi:MAG: M14 family metallopeptidase [Chthoniobacterales bacterium]
MGRARPIQHARAHDYGHLIRRWRSVARSHGLRLTPYASASGYELFYAETRRPKKDRPWIYLSAGIHGDEPAATEACLEWVASTRFVPDDFNVMAFPCLNPWGLVNNLRRDEDGRDLNRTYHSDSVPQTAAHKALLAGRRFALALALHEDYDANGAYIYELREARPWWAEKLLQAASHHVPIDSRRTIEGRNSRAGIMRRVINLVEMPEHPEVFVLYFQNACRIFTIETPSEAHIDSRVAAHVAMIECAARLCLAKSAP